MSIFPATDIISDVARAADPGKVRLVMKRLEDAGGERLSEAAGFASVKAAAAPARMEARLMTTDTAAPAATRTEPLDPMAPSRLKGS
jgi:hypothetical protein